METLFQDLERLLEIETLTYDHEASCAALEADVAYENDELRYAKVQLLSLDSPNFFLKLMPAKLEKKRELAQAEIRAHTAALEKAKRDLEAKRYALEALEQEYQSLLPRREEYAAGKGSFPAELEQHLACCEGIHVAGRVLFYLAESKKHQRNHTRNDFGWDDNRQMEFMSMAAQEAKKLKELLDRLPTPLTLKGSYLSWPEHYITEPTSYYAQMDRMNLAIDTVRDVRRQLRELI